MLRGQYGYNNWFFQKKNFVVERRTAVTERKYVYVFGPDGAEGNREMRDLLGGKGANLAEMAHLKLPVPPGFTITTEACRYWLEHGALPPELPKQIHRAMRHLERTMQRHFGHAEYPLLVSVRSGAPVSMPGMMDTILNLGLNHETVEGLVRMTGNLRFAHDCWRRFIAMFADVVLEIDDTYFEDILTQEKRRADVRQDFELTPPEILRVIERSFTLIEEHLPTRSLGTAFTCNRSCIPLMEESPCDYVSGAEAYS